MASSPTRLKVDLDTMRACETQKVCFRTRAEALDAAERLMHLGRVTPGCHITPYECDRCGRWHVRNRVIVALPGINVANQAREIR